MRQIRLLALAAAFALPAGLALAQTTPQPANPLRPGAAATRTAPPPQATAPDTKAEAPKPKRQRSEAQLANDNRMRACGQEWRQNKAALTAQGKTWRVFNVECRARLKARGR